ncbi:MAG: CRISPR-associated endoribonuclease Cas6 [Prevotellaceae bacterium]|jgi:CRISPR-associated endoribonuclease Cas6|nr:CRISPR-associated endoribonuclease Cas6 [Prevotellaceae bacterium]
MRFKLLLQIHRNISGNLLPLNYQYPLSAWIYGIIAKSDAAYSTWLHDNGFSSVDSSKHFKLFTFSNLWFADAKPLADRLAIFSDTAELQLSFLPEKSTEEFIKGIFSEKEFSLGDRKSRVHFRVQGIEMLPPPVFGMEARFQTLSPITVSLQEETGRIAYLSPETDNYGQLLINNLKEKYRSFYQKPFVGDEAFEFELLSSPQSKLITIKANTREETRVRGYHCRFRLRADGELLRIMYSSGAGEKGSLGFGMVKILQ